MGLCPTSATITHGALSAVLITVQRSQQHPVIGLQNRSIVAPVGTSAQSTTRVAVDCAVLSCIPVCWSTGVPAKKERCEIGKRF
jgi:hypothetical protein